VGMGIGTLPEIDQHSHIHNHSKTVGMGIGTLSEIDHHFHIHKHSKTVASFPGHSHLQCLITCSIQIQNDT